VTGRAQASHVTRPKLLRFLHLVRLERLALDKVLACNLRANMSRDAALLCTHAVQTLQDKCFSTY
jgi:hypothetical protein